MRQGYRLLALAVLVATLLVTSISAAGPASAAATGSGNAGGAGSGNQPAPSGGGGGGGGGAQTTGGGGGGQTTGGGGAQTPVKTATAGPAPTNGAPQNAPTDSGGAKPTGTGAASNAPQTSNALPTSKITGGSNNPLPSLPSNPYAGANGTMSWQQCVDYGKYCRDVLCQYQNYTATCKGNGGCTCVGPIWSKGEPTSHLYTGPIVIITIISILYGFLH